MSQKLISDLLFNFFFAEEFSLSSTFSEAINFILQNAKKSHSTTGGKCLWFPEGFRVHQGRSIP